MRPLLKTTDGWELQHPPSLFRWLLDMDGRDDACVVVDNPKVYYFATEEKRDQALATGRNAKMFADLLPLLPCPEITADGVCDRGRRMEGCEPWAVCSGKEECGGERRFCSAK